MRGLYFTDSGLSSRFTKYCGCTFLEYVTRYRIMKAKELLRRTNLSIKEIAAQVGYTDLAYFGRVFRRETGQTPSKYRNLASCGGIRICE
ncbi:MAG: helix-turn-helix domain-containing protein [Bacillota bacterium]